MAKTRVFVAVPIGEAVRAQATAAIEMLRSPGDNVKWVAPENLHWTLHFLGEITDDEIAQVCRRVVRAAGDFTPFELVATGISAFPKQTRPRTLWLGAGQGGEELIALHAAIGDELADLGFRGERRPFVPHLTLGRVGRDSSVTAALADRLTELTGFDGGAMQVGAVAVFASRLRREAPSYQILATAKFGN